MCFECELAALFGVAAHHLGRQFSLSIPSSFHCGKTGALFPFPVWGLMAGLPGFASHGSSLHLGAGC